MTNFFDSFHAPSSKSVSDDICCEACGSLINVDQPYHRTHDGNLCGACAPTYQDMLDTPENFLNSDEEEMTAEEAHDFVQAHVNSGGNLTDTILNGGKK